MPRGARLAATSVLLGASLLGAGCGGGLEAQERPSIVAVFPAAGAVLPGWLDAVRVTYDEPVTVLNEEAVEAWAGDESIDCVAVPDPSDPASIFVLPDGGRWVPGAEHVVIVREGVVVNADLHYALDQVETRFTIGPRPTMFVATSTGDVHEVDPGTGGAVSTTAPPAGYVAGAVAGADDEVFVWLRDTGGGDDVLGWFAPGDATATVVPLAGEVGLREGLGFAVSVDGKTLYATTFDAGTSTVRVHRVDTATRAEVGAPLGLSTAFPGAARVARRPALDPRRHRLYVAMDDGAGAGAVAVVDLATFAEVDVVPGPGTAAPVAEGAGDLSFGLDTDRVWMTIADEPNAGLVVVDPSGFGTFSAREQELTTGPVASLLTPDERFFVQGLAGYADRRGIVFSRTDDVGEGFPRLVDDDLGGVLQGSDTVAALVIDPGTGNLLALATGTGATVLVAYDVEEDDLAPVDFDDGVEGSQGLDLSASAPGDALAATFLRGAHAP